MKASMLQGMPIVSMREGIKLGTIEELLVDVPSLRMAAAQVKVDHERALLPFSAIRGIGPDAIMVEQSGDLETGDVDATSGSWRKLGDLKQLPVVSANGVVLGELRDVELGDNGRITAIEVHQGGVLGLGGTTLAVAAEQVRSIARLVTVDALDETNPSDRSFERPAA
jgi:uncharacterized protein YrrD